MIRVNDKTSIKYSNWLDLDQITKLHQKTLVSPGSKIGPKFLKKLYGLLFENPKLHILLKAEKDGKIVGFLSASYDLDQTNQILGQIFSLDVIIQTIKVILLGKLSLGEILNRVLFEEKIKPKLKPPYLYILAIFVDQKFQRQGLGKKLVAQLLNEAKSAHIKRIYIDTYKSNNTAVLFYQSLGFLKMIQITDSWLLRYDSPNEEKNTKEK